MIHDIQKYVILDNKNKVHIVPTELSRCCVVSLPLIKPHREAQKSKV